MTIPQAIAKALKRINKEFAEALDGKIEDELTDNAQKVWEEKAFDQTVKNAIETNGPKWFDDLANKRYVLAHVRLIARIARYYRDKANDAKVSESQLKKTIDLVIQQARYTDCPPKGTPPAGKSCHGYTKIEDLDV